MNTHKQNKTITIRLSQELIKLLLEQFDPHGFLTLSQVIRQALSGSLTSNPEVNNGGE